MRINGAHQINYIKICIKITKKILYLEIFLSYFVVKLIDRAMKLTISKYVLKSQRKYYTQRFFLSYFVIKLIKDDRAIFVLINVFYIYSISFMKNNS